MRNKVLLFLFSLLAFLPAKAQTEVTDTLLNASTASALRIKTDEAGISIVVRNIDGSGENFYYSTYSQKSDDLIEIVSTIFRDIRDITIVEVDSKNIEIRFNNSTSNPNVLSYVIPDPDNRVVKSYIGDSYRNFGFNLSQKGRSSWSLVTKGLGFGWVTPLNAPADMNTSMGRSMEWTWACVAGAQWSYDRHSITMGLGLDWRNYTMKGSRYFHKENNGEISIRQFEDGEHNGRSRLLTFSLQIPVLYDIRFGHRKYFGFTVGPILNFNTGGSIKTKYEHDGRKYTVKTGKIGQSPVTVDIMGIIHYRAIGIYARYAPMKVLRTSAGLDFQSFSTGLMIVL